MLLIVGSSRARSKWRLMRRLLKRLCILSGKTRKQRVSRGDWAAGIVVETGEPVRVSPRGRDA